VALPFVVAALSGPAQTPLLLQLAQATGLGLAIAPVVSYLGLNFTGATPFTSRSAVRREIAAYIPPIAWALGLGILLIIASAVASRLLGQSG
jgi:hypothetical protein